QCRDNLRSHGRAYPGQGPASPGEKQALFPERQAVFKCLSAGVLLSADAGAADAPYLYRHLCPAVTTRKLRVYFFHCPDRAASAPSPSDPLADIRLSGRQEVARGKCGKG